VTKSLADFSLFAKLGQDIEPIQSLRFNVTSKPNKNPLYYNWEQQGKLYINSESDIEVGTEIPDLSLFERGMQVFTSALKLMQGQSDDDGYQIIGEDVNISEILSKNLSITPGIKPADFEAGKHLLNYLIPITSLEKSSLSGCEIFTDTPIKSTFFDMTLQGMHLNSELL